MPFYIPKVTHLILIQNVFWIFLLVISGISVITDTSRYQWIIFPIDLSYNFILCLYYNNTLRKHYKDVLKIYFLKQLMILSIVLTIGVCIFYNLFVIKEEQYPAIVIAIHNTTFFIQFIIYVLGVRVTKDMELLRRIIEYYRNDNNFDNIEAINRSNEHQTSIHVMPGSNNHI